ncbi:glycosyltransferase family A protein [Aquimarina sp. M1]
MYSSAIKINNSKVDLEILIATTFKSDLAFLNTLFHKDDGFENYHLLIVNQTDDKNLLSSDSPNVRIINSFDSGTTRSRNVAIQNAIGKVCLICDDDTKYVKGLKAIVLSAHNKHREADLVTFRAVDDKDNLYTTYPKAGRHSLQSLRSIYSWVISFKRERLQQNGLYFDENFGINSLFHPGEEYVFLRDCFKKRIKMYHQPEVIVMHPFKTSGKEQDKDHVVFSRAAIQYKYNGSFAYLWLFKYVVFLWKNDYISYNKIISKISHGLRGIKAYQKVGVEHDK